MTDPVHLTEPASTPGAAGENHPEWYDRPVGVALCVGIGVGIDALHSGWTTVYDARHLASPSSPSARLGTPRPAPAALAVTLSF